MINNSVLTLLLLGCHASSAEPEAFQGVLEFEETVLSFETSGKIASLPVKEGDRIEANGVVAILDDEMLRAERQAQRLEADAARAQAELVRAGAKRDDVRALEARVRAAAATESLLEKNLARERSLFERNVVPRASLDDMEARYASARAEREGLEFQLTSLERGARSQEVKGAFARADAADAALRVEDERLERHSLHAPVVGRVLDEHVEPGEVVAAGTPVVTIGDTQRPYVDVFVPQGRLGGIQVGNQASLRVDAESTAFSGRVERISNRTEFTPRFLFSERERPNLVVRVRVRIDDPKERLHAGVPAFVTIARTPGSGKP